MVARARFAGGAALQVLIEERQHHVAAELRGGVAVPLERRPDVEPSRLTWLWNHGPITSQLLTSWPAAFSASEAVVGAPHVLLVPQPLLPHGRHVGGMLGDQLVQRLALPERVIGRDAPSSCATHGSLLQAVRAGVVARRAGLQELLVVVGRDRGGPLPSPFWAVCSAV